MNEELKEVVKGAIAESLEEVNSETKTAIDALEVRLKDVEEGKEESERVADEAGISKSKRKSFGMAIKGLYVQLKGAPQGMKADEYTHIGSGDSAEDIVGEEIANGFLRIAENNGVILSHANVIKSTSQTHSSIVDTTADDNGSFIDEDATAERNKLVFKKVSLVAKKWKKAIAVSEDAIKFSEPENLGNYIIKKLGEHFGAFIDEVAFTAITANVEIPAVVMAGTAFGGLTYDNLVDMVSSAPDSLDDKCVWAGSKSILGIIRKMKDGDSRPLIDSKISGALIEAYRGNGKAPRAELLNYPFFTASGMPKATDTGADKAFLFFGSLDDLVSILLADGLAVESDKNILNGNIDYVGTRYLDAKVILPKAGALLKTSV